MNRAVCTAGQRLADHLSRPRRSSRHDNDFAGVLLFETKRLFERVGVRLVQLEAGILVADPALVLVNAKLPLSGDNLFDTDGDFHASLPAGSFQLPASSCQL